MTTTETDQSSEGDLYDDDELWIAPADEPVESLNLPIRQQVVTDETLGTLLPLREELSGLAALARTLALASVVPDALKHKPADVLAILLTGRELGVAPMTAIRNFHVINGSVSIAPKFKVAEVHKRGLGRVYPHQPPRLHVDPETGEETDRLCPCGMMDPANDHEQAMWHAERRDMPGVIYTSRFTLEDAARIIVPIYDRVKKASVDQPITEKTNWKHYPQRMLSWRALGYLIDDAFSEIGTGLYSPDELGAVTDEDGEPILDVKSKDTLVPADDRIKPAGSSASPPIQPDVLADFKRRIEKLHAHPEAYDELLAAYKAREDLPRLDELRHSQQPVVAALIAHVEDKVRKGVYGPADETPEPQPEPEPESEPPAEPEPDQAIDVTESTETPATAVETPAEPEPVVVPLPFDPDGLPAGHSQDEDRDWAKQAPADWISRVTAEVGALPADEVKSRLKAFSLPTGGGDAPTRTRLAWRLVRREMEKAMGS